jgi:NADH:ubiquinone oxidoreductase subunit E
MLDRAAEGVLGNAGWMSPERGKSVMSELGVPADKAEAFARYWQSIRRDNQGKNTRQPLAEHYASPLGEMAQTAL